MTPSSILDAARNLLAGEPLRAIGYGAAVIVYLVTNASGRFADLTFDEAFSAATVAITTVIGIVETARRFVYSKPTVEVLVGDAAFTGDPSVPAQRRDLT